MPPIDTAPPEDDLRASIEAQFEASDAAAPSEPPAAAEPSENVDVAAAPEVTEPKGDHPTDPRRFADGTFKPTKTDKSEAAPSAPDKPAAAAPKAAKEQPSTDATAKPSEAASTQTLAPPAGWTAAEKAEWSKLPPAVQAAVSRREQEIANGGRQWSEEKRRYEHTLGPVAQEAARLGITTQEALNRLVGAHHALLADAPGTIRALARDYGVDLATLVGQPSAEGSQQPSVQQPDIEALVRRAVQPILAPIQDRIRSEDSQRQQSILDSVTAFATAPGHEHFEAVQDELMAMIPTIKAMNPAWGHDKILQEAYDRAVYANPSTRAAVLAAANATADAKRQADAQARAKNARTAASSVTGAPNGSAGNVVPDSLRATIEAAMTGG